MIRITNTLGEEKEILFFYDDGHYTCPFCIYPAKDKCKNPACETNLTAERILKIRKELAAEKKELENRLRMFTYLGKRK